MMSTSRLLQKGLSALKQGGTLSIRSRVPNTSIRIIPEWREDGHLAIVDGENHVNLTVTQNDDMLTSLGRSESHLVVEVNPKDDSSSSSSISLEARVPEKTNLSCHLEQGGTIQIDKKLEGDVDLSTTEGDILLHKIRGYQIALQTPKGIIYASDLLEAQRLSLSSGGRVRAKRIHGSQLDIHVNQQQSSSSTQVDTQLMDADDEGAAIDISSLYVSGTGETNLVAQSLSTSNSSIRCKSNHGHVNAKANHQIDMGGVNGSFDVASTEGEAHVHIDSLSSESISIVTSKKMLLLTLDRKLEADLRLVCGESVQELGRSVLLEDDEESIRQGLQQHQEGGPLLPISVVTSAFTEKALSGTEEPLTNLSYVQGHVDNQSLEPDSRFEQQQHLGGGKIRLEGAANQALHGFASNDDGDDGIERPLVVGASEERIAVESLSWLGAIARRYGLEESDRKEDLGRQATRRGRDLEPSSKD
jgi:hypothetical protein